MASVVLSRCEKYDANRIETLLENALEQLPEIPQLHPGAKVLVKPNLLMKRDPRRGRGRGARAAGARLRGHAGR